VQRAAAVAAPVAVEAAETAAAEVAAEDHTARTPAAAAVRQRQVPKQSASTVGAEHVGIELAAVLGSAGTGQGPPMAEPWGRKQSAVVLKRLH